MIKILTEHSIPYLRGVLEELGEVTYLPTEAFTPDTVRDADWLIVRSITKCTPQLLEGSSVRLITSATIGYDHIDTDYCDRNGIAWYNAPGCNAGGVGQYFGGVLSYLAVNHLFDPRGKTIGIVGVGHTGSYVARYAEAMGMRLLLNDPPRAEQEGDGAFVDYSTILKESDLISYHVPLTRKGPHATYHLFNSEAARMIRRRPIVANFCRGAVTDTTALIEAKEQGALSALLIDCWEDEPHISTRLLDTTLLATPHIAGFSADGKSNAAKACVQRGLEFFGLSSSHIDMIAPAPPKDPIIDLADFPDDGLRLFRAILRTYNPYPVDQQLRKEYGDFEKLRRSYDYPREPHAYTVVHASDDEAKILSRVGFNIG